MKKSKEGRESERGRDRKREGEKERITHALLQIIR